MFSIDDLSPCLTEKWLTSGHAAVERNILSNRLGLQIDAIDSSVRTALKRFSQAVIASAATWPDPRSGAARSLCQLAGDIEAGLTVGDDVSRAQRHLGYLKAMILYDLAGLPGAAASYAKRNGLDHHLRDFFFSSTRLALGPATERTDNTSSA